MQPFMRKTLAIALLAGSTFSVVPAIAQTQAPAGGADTTTPVIPRQGQGATQGSGAMQGQGQGQMQGQGQSQSMGQASGSEKGNLKAQGGAQGNIQGQSNSQAQDSTGSQKAAPQADSAQQKPGSQPGRTDPSSAANTDKSRNPAANNDTARQNNGQTNGTQQNQNADQAKTDRPSNEITGSINVTTEQKTELRQVFVEEKVKPVSVDVQVTVGTAIPRTVELHPLPSRIVEIVPAYRGYEYFVLADGRIIIVKPATHEVVYILAG